MRRSLAEYVPGLRITVNDRMQSGYSYVLTYRAGTHIRDGGLDAQGNKIRYEGFHPAYTPARMLAMGVFEGKYINDCEGEFPREWYDKSVKKRVGVGGVANPSLNKFKIKSRLSLQEWRRRGWTPVHPKDSDVRAWFQWYCRYWLGRRIPEVDAHQIKRWKAFGRHYAQVAKHAKGDLTKRKKQRQALLQWSWPCMD